MCHLHSILRAALVWGSMSITIILVPGACRTGFVQELMAPFLVEPVEPIMNSQSPILEQHSITFVNCATPAQCVLTCSWHSHLKPLLFETTLGKLSFQNCATVQAYFGTTLPHFMTIQTETTTVKTIGGQRACFGATFTHFCQKLYSGALHFLFL